MFRTLCQNGDLDHVGNVLLTNWLPNGETQLLREEVDEEEDVPRNAYVLVLGVCAPTAVVGKPVQFVADVAGNRFCEARSGADATPVFKFI